MSKDGWNHPEYLRIEAIDHVTIEEIKRVAKKCVKPGSTIISDGHTSYKPLAEEGFFHEAKAYYKENKDDFLKMLHIIIGNVKAYIQGTYHGLGSQYLQSYFDEFCFRFNRRFNPKEIFDRLLNVCVLSSPHSVN